MFFKGIERSKIRSSQIVGATIANLSLRAWVERSVLQTVARVYSDDQPKVSFLCFVEEGEVGCFFDQFWGKVNKYLYFEQN